MATETKATSAKSTTPASPSEETKRQKFIRVGGARMTKTLSQIRLLGNLSGAGYEYSEKDVAIIENAVKDVLAKALTRLRSRSTETKEPAFTFGS